MINFDSASSLPASELASSLSKSGLTRFLNRAQVAVGLPGQVDVLLTGDGAMKRLNRTYRGKNKATDVLSFPALSAAEGGSVGIAGDIAISLDTAMRQAAEFGHSLRDEVRILLLHGLLHLSGMDHETDSGEMALREEALQRMLRLPTTLTGRAQVAPVRLGKAR